MTRVRRLTRWAARCTALIALLVPALLVAPSAVAGGPTSVLLAQPESTETAALYGTDKEYGQLSRLLGPAKGEPEKPPGVDMATGGSRQINVTWLLHDVTPWRVDRVHAATEKGEPLWIHTSTRLTAGRLDLSRGVWHRAERPDELRALLTRLGVMGKSSADRGDAVPWPAESHGGEEETAAVPVSSPASTASPASDASTGWWWALPGMIAGATLALLLRGRRIGDDPEPGPRQELVDL